ncbi:hypothetical protein OHA21_50100 [Actinoplanes sp. NBC_00393]|uniref:hypothetical protein n=1 Tax=Actinoplanes sp. NBC_00393 TaxID=2975953 RepID=UPI002E1B01C9
MSHDEQLRALFSDIAGQAHDPARLAPEIVARARTHRQRRGLLMAAGAAGTTAVLGGTGVAGWLWSSRTTPVAEGPGIRVPLRYGLGWVPAGFAEESRSATVPGSGVEEQGRNWRGDGQIYLQLEPAQMNLRRHLRTTTIAGRLAWDFPGEPSHQIYLEIDDETWLMVGARVPGNKADVARKLAESVTAESSAVCEVSLTFGWLPERFAGVRTIGLGRIAKSTNETLIVQHKDGPARIVVQMGPIPEPSPGGTRATVRGHDALVREGSVPLVDVDLGGDRRLRLSGLSPQDVTLEELIHVANEVRIGRPPDTSWLQR